jgi:signal transduction histidine kinase
MRINCFRIILCLFALPAYANPIDSIDVSQIDQMLDLRGHGFYVKTAATASIQEVVSMLGKTERVRNLDKINLGYNDSILWLIIPIKNLSRSNENLLLEIQNPHIDRLQAYCISNRGIQTVGDETGDAHPFNTRYVKHRNFLWPLHACESDAFTLIIKIDKRNSSLFIPAYLVTESKHRLQSSRTNIFYGICFGMMILIVLYSITAGVFLKSRIYFLYAGFILSAILFLATAEGLSFQFIYPNTVDFNSLFRGIMVGVTSISMTLFTRDFLNTVKYTPGIDRILLSIALIFTVFLPFSIIFDKQFFQQSQLILPIVLGLAAIANLSGLLAAVISIPQQRNTSIFYIVAYLAIVVTGIITITEDFGWIEKIPFNIMFIGALFEIIVFSVGLTYRVKKVYDERNDLSQKISRHQKEMMHAYVQGIEKERERIAGELHDNIGSRLSNLRRIISQKNAADPEYMEEQLQILENDVRALSHQMSPTAIQFKGLTQVATDLIADLQNVSATTFTIQCYDVPEPLSEQITHQIYRVIQEAAQNIVKHAQATEADIQLFGHETELVVTIEDNGRGFHSETASTGLGLFQIKARVESLGGNIEISSVPGYGTQLMITVPLA